MIARVVRADRACAGICSGCARRFTLRIFILAIVCSGCLGSAVTSSSSAGGGGSTSSSGGGGGVEPITTVDGAASLVDAGVVGAAPAVSDDFEGGTLAARWNVVGAEGHQAPQP